MRSCGWRHFLLVIIVPITLQAQDYTWWNEAQNWDGLTHWTSYLNLAPASMGPNAFPIPKPEKMIESNGFESSYNYHRNPGEKSWDFYSRFSFLLGDKASLKLALNPVEYFEFNAQIRDERAARDFSPKGYASGDLLVEMNALVFEKNNRQLIFNSAIKTASGSQIRNARYTDTPAYYFNLTYYQNNNISERLSVDFGFLLGLYVWQTYMVNNRQNDAVLAAISLNLSFKDFILSNDIKGFSGYLGQGDKPLLYMLKMSKCYNMFNLFVANQWSLNDYPYHTTQFGLNYMF